MPGSRVTNTCLHGNQLRAVHRLTDVKPGPPQALGTLISAVLVVAMMGCSAGSDQANRPVPNQRSVPRSEPATPKGGQESPPTHRPVLVYAHHQAVPIRGTGRFVWHSKTLPASAGTP